MGCETERYVLGDWSREKGGLTRMERRRDATRQTTQMSSWWRERDKTAYVPLLQVLTSQRHIVPLRTTVVAGRTQQCREVCSTVKKMTRVR